VLVLVLCVVFLSVWFGAAASNFSQSRDIGDWENATEKHREISSRDVVRLQLVHLQNAALLSLRPDELWLLSPLTESIFSCVLCPSTSIP